MQGLAQMAAGAASYNPALGAFAGNTGYTNAAMGGQTALSQYLGSNGNPAAAMLGKTANGDYLNSNPYLNEAIANSNRGLIDQFKTEIAPGIDSQFAGAGRMGSNAFAQARNKAESTLAGAMSNNANNIRRAPASCLYTYPGHRTSDHLSAAFFVGLPTSTEFEVLAYRAVIASYDDVDESGIYLPAWSDIVGGYFMPCLFRVVGYP